MSASDKADPSAAVAPHAQNSASGEQLPLLPGQSSEQRDQLLPIPKAANLKVATTGAGRPLGARNRRTDLMAQYLVERYGDPLEGDVALGMMPLRDLIRELREIGSDCGMKLDLSVGDLLRIQATARASALPFIHAKRAPEDHKGDPVLPVVAIGTLNQQNNTIVQAPSGMSLEDRLDNAKTIEHQRVSDNEQK